MKAKLNEIRKAMGLGTSTTDFRNQNQFGYWAPCVRRISKDLYRMYYVVTLPGTINGAGTWSERCFIGLMETKNPADIDSWVDKGFVVTNYSDLELNYKVSATDYAHCYFKYNAIDPSLIINEKGEHWLIYGSWHSGFAAMQLDPSTGKPLHALGNPWARKMRLLTVSLSILVNMETVGRQAKRLKLSIMTAITISSLPMTNSRLLIIPAWYVPRILTVLTMTLRARMLLIMAEMLILS